jgi:hypothetical protein
VQRSTLLSQFAWGRKRRRRWRRRRRETHNGQKTKTIKITPNKKLKK